MRKTLGLLLAVALVLTAVMAAPAAADTKYTCPVGDFDGDLELSAGPVCNIGSDISGNVTSDGRRIVIAPGGSVDGNVEVNGRSIEIRGTVGGNVTQLGPGGVLVRGSVDGNAVEYGSGDLRLRGTAAIKGNVGEYGAGDCIIGPAVFIDGTIEGGC